MTFAIGALFSAATGVLLLGFTGSAYTADVGQPITPDDRGRGCRWCGIDRRAGSYLGTIAGALVLTEINTLLIGLGFQPSAVQAALGVYNRRAGFRSMGVNAS